MVQTIQGYIIPLSAMSFFYGYHEASQLELGCHGNKMTTNALGCCTSIVHLNSETESTESK